MEELLKGRLDILKTVECNSSKLLCILTQLMQSRLLGMACWLPIYMLPWSKTSKISFPPFPLGDSSSCSPRRESMCKCSCQIWSGSGWGLLLILYLPLLRLACCSRPMLSGLFFVEALVFVFFVPCTKKQNPTSCECSKVKRMVVGLGTGRVRVHIFASCKCCNCLKRLNETNYEP